MLAAVVSSVFAQPLAQFVPPRVKLSEADDVEVAIRVQEASLDEVLQVLREQTGMLIIAGHEVREALKHRKFSLEEKGKISAVLVRVSMRLEALPRAAVIYCAEKELPKRRPQLDIPDRKVTAGVQNVRTDAALLLLSKATGISMTATPHVLQAHPTLSVSFDDKPVAEAIDATAEVLEAKWAPGVVLERFDREQAFQRFMSLPPQQQEAILLDATRQAGQMGLSYEQFDQGVERGLKEFFNMPQEQRRQIVSRVAEGIRQFAGRMRQFSPEGIAQLQDAWKPYIQRAVARFLALPANQQAELAPIVQALRELPFSW